MHQFMVDLLNFLHGPKSNSYPLFMQSNTKYYKYPPGKKNESFKALDINTNICKFYQKQNKGNIFVSYVINIVRHYGKLPTSCPIKVVSDNELTVPLYCLNFKYFFYFRDYITHTI